MKTLEKLFAEITSSEKMKEDLAAACKEKKLGSFLKSAGCEFSEKEFIDYVSAKTGDKTTAVLSDEELQNVAGGVLSSIFLFFTCNATSD